MTEWVAKTDESINQWFTNIIKDAATGAANEIGTTLIAVLPEAFLIAGMSCMLIGMTGSERFMKYSGTCLLLSMIGGVINAVI